MSAALLSACTDKKVVDPDVGDPFSGRAVAAQNDRAGNGFEAASRANPNSEPVKVKEGDVKPVSLTDEPIDVR